MAKLLCRYHLIAGFFWLLMIPTAFYTGLSKSVPFLTFISLWALVVGEFAAYQASRVERKGDENDSSLEPTSCEGGSSFR